MPNILQGKIDNLVNDSSYQGLTSDLKAEYIQQEFLPALLPEFGQMDTEQQKTYVREEFLPKVDPNFKLDVIPQVSPKQTHPVGTGFGTEVSDFFKNAVNTGSAGIINNELNNPQGIGSTAGAFAGPLVGTIGAIAAAPETGFASLAIPAGYLGLTGAGNTAREQVNRTGEIGNPLAVATSGAVNAGFGLIPGAGQGLKLLPRVGLNAVREGGANIAADAVQQAAEQQTFTPELDYDRLKFQGLIGGGLGGGLSIAGGGRSPQLNPKADTPIGLSRFNLASSEALPVAPQGAIQGRATLNSANPRQRVREAKENLKSFKTEQQNKVDSELLQTVDEIHAMDEFDRVEVEKTLKEIAKVPEKTPERETARNIIRELRTRKTQAKQAQVEAKRFERLKQKEAQKARVADEKAAKIARKDELSQLKNDIKERSNPGKPHPEDISEKTEVKDNTETKTIEVDPESLSGLESVKDHPEVKARPEIIGKLSESAKNKELIKVDYNAEIAGERLDPASQPGYMVYEISVTKKNQVIVKTIDADGNFTSFKLDDGEGNSRINDVELTGVKSPHELFLDADNPKKNGDPRLAVRKIEGKATVEQNTNRESLKTSELQKKKSDIVDTLSGLTNRDVVNLDASLKKMKIGKLLVKKSGLDNIDKLDHTNAETLLKDVAKHLDDAQSEKAVNQLLKNIPPETRKKIFKELLGEDC